MTRDFICQLGLFRASISPGRELRSDANMIRTPDLGLPRNSIPARSNAYRALICRAITASLTMLAGSALLSCLSKYDPRFAFRFPRSSDCRSGPTSPSVQRPRSCRCSTKDSPGSNRMREAANPKAPGESRKVGADEMRHEIDATDHGAKACVSNAKLMGSRKGVGRFTADPFCKKRDLRWSTALPIPWLTRSPGPLSRRVPAGISPPQTAALGPTPASASRNPGNQLVNCHAQNPRHLSIAALLSDHCLQSLALSAVMRDFGLHPGFFRDPISPRRALRSDAT
jgi:hypothetical protein